MEWLKRKVWRVKLHEGAKQLLITGHRQRRKALGWLPWLPSRRQFPHQRSKVGRRESAGYRQHFHIRL